MNRPGKNIAILLIIGLGLYLGKDYLMRPFFSPTPTQIPLGATKKNLPQATVFNQPEDNIKILAENLTIPWEIEFLPNGDLLVTERSGKLLQIGTTTKTIFEISGVEHVGEGGLLGLALAPDFLHTNFIYLYYTFKNNGILENRVERYRLVKGNLTDRTVILKGIKGAPNHDGGRLAFGPDGKLYVTTGDAQQPDLAQDINSLNGKILRINPDGSIPGDNPFANAVYSYGHRNPQGLAWDSQGRLWATEHGPSGIETGNDEVNLIVKGGNYGWPEIRGKQTQAGMIAPVIESGRQDTWAPASLTIINDTLYFGGLRGEALYSAQIHTNRLINLKRHFQSEFGRIRAVKVGPDGWLYISTSNRDGRGDINSGDDKIIRINPQILN